MASLFQIVDCLPGSTVGGVKKEGRNEGGNGFFRTMRLGRLPSYALRTFRRKRGLQTASWDDYNPVSAVTQPPFGSTTQIIIKTSATVLYALKAAFSHPYNHLETILLKEIAEIGPEV